MFSERESGIAGRACKTCSQTHSVNMNLEWKLWAARSDGLFCIGPILMIFGKSADNNCEPWTLPKSWSPHIHTGVLQWCQNPGSGIGTSLLGEIVMSLASLHQTQHQMLLNLHHKQQLHFKALTQEQAECKGALQTQLQPMRHVTLAITGNKACCLGAQVLFQNQVGGPAVCRPDTWRSLLVLPVAAALPGWLSHHLPTATEDLKVSLSYNFPGSKSPVLTCRSYKTSPNVVCPHCPQTPVSPLKIMRRIVISGSSPCYFQYKWSHEPPWGFPHLSCFTDARLSASWTSLGKVGGGTF